MSERTFVSLYEAKTHLSELGERAANGEEIVVTKHGKPRFKLVAAMLPAARPAPGGNPMGISYLSEDFDAPDEQIERLFGLAD